MHLQSVIAATGGLVVATNALLLPPDLPVAPENEIISTLPIAIENDINIDMLLADIPGFQTVMVECPGCLLRPHGRKPHNVNKGKHSNPMMPARIPAYEGKHHKGDRKHKEIPSHLKLDFGIEPSETTAADRLIMNGYELYPNPDPSQRLPVAAVLPDRQKMGEEGQMPGHFKGLKGIPSNAFQSIGFGMHSSVVSTTDEGEDLELINVEVQVMQVGDKFNDGIDEIVVTLVKSASGKLAISRILTVGKPKSPEEPQCSTTLCKWKAVIMGKLQELKLFKPCAGRKGGMSMPHGQMAEHEHGHGPHHHMHHGNQHPWARFVVRIVTHILLPVLIGILAGVSAGLIGMMVGTLIVFVWRMLFRRQGVRHSHRCRYARRAAQQEAATVPDEKAGLMEEPEEVTDLPPKYDETETRKPDVEQ